MRGPSAGELDRAAVEKMFAAPELSARADVFFCVVINASKETPMRLAPGGLAAVLSTLSLAACALSTSAVAGPPADLAQARIASIAKGDVATVTAQDAPDALLHWIGGPLDGTYEAGRKAEVWSKFAKAQGPQSFAVANLTEAGNPKGSTVTADLTFAGTNTVKVHYVMVYRGDKLVDEIWQVNPQATY
jgi:hypothetical protein